MKNDSGVRFDKKELIVQMYKEIRLMKHTAEALRDMCQDSEDRVHKELGLVPPANEDNGETIEIDRKVAEKWINTANVNSLYNDYLFEEIKKALSGRGE